MYTRTCCFLMTLQTLPLDDEGFSGSGRVAKLAGFSLHAGVMAEANDRNKLERLWRYITRPALSEQRLPVTEEGRVC